MLEYSLDEYAQVDITMIVGNKEKDQQKSILAKVLYVSKLATNLYSSARDKGTCTALTANLEIKHQLIMKLLQNWICGTKEWRT